MRRALSQLLFVMLLLAPSNAWSADSVINAPATGFDITCTGGGQTYDAIFTISDGATAYYTNMFKSLVPNSNPKVWTDLGSTSVNVNANGTYTPTISLGAISPSEVRSGKVVLTRVTGAGTGIKATNAGTFRGP